MYWLWYLNIIGTVLVVFRVYLVARGRRPKVIEMRRKVLREVTEKLQRLPKRNDLIELWCKILPADQANDTYSSLGLICHLQDAEKVGNDGVKQLQLACKSYVDICNTSLAVRIDDGLLHAKRFVRSRPELHEDLVRTIPLVEPVIWHTSLVRGMGRWGYRVLALHDVLDRLRATSHRREIRAEMCDVIKDGVAVVHPQISWWARAWRSLCFLFAAPTINVRTKLRQRKRADEMAKSLVDQGIDLPNPRAVPW